MIPPDMTNRFNTMRAFIACGSPQVSLNFGNIVLLDECGNPETRVAKLVTTDSYRYLQEAIKRDRRSVILDENPDVPLRYRYRVLLKLDTHYSRVLAYMLTY